MEGDPLQPPNWQAHEISIHSLRMEGDPDLYAQLIAEIDISIHSLRMEGDFPCFPIVDGKRDFNPLPPHGGRLPPVFCPDRPPHFNPLPPHGGRRRNGSS